jgi:hypothetical protein
VATKLRLSWNREHFWDVVTMHPEEHRWAVVALDRHGFHVLVGSVASLDDIEPLVKVAGARGYPEIRLIQPSRSKEVPDREATVRTALIDFER